MHIFKLQNQLYQNKKQENRDWTIWQKPENKSIVLRYLGHLPNVLFMFHLRSKEKMKEIITY